jgi:hypothetical protein
VYLVDEASMISDNQDQSTSFARYGSGNLLMDLFAYHPQGKFVFAGDLCQLPPFIRKFHRPSMPTGLKINTTGGMGN